jgi:hypothetical protein
MTLSVVVEEKDLGWNRIKRELKIFDKSYTAAGYFGSGGTPATDVAARAAVNEFGATIKVTQKMRGYLAAVLGIHLRKTTTVIRIPKRPYNRKTFDKNKKNIKNKITEEYNAILEGQRTARRALSRLGEWYVGLIKLTVRKGGFAPNSKITTDRKGSSKPLIDTREMINATTHREFFK